MKREWPVTVVHMVLSLRPGGRGTTILDLVQNADPALFKPLVCCLDEAGRPVDGLRSARVEVMGRGRGLDLGLILRVARFLRSEKVAVLHTHEAGSLFYGALAGKLAGVPAIVNTYHRSMDIDVGTAKARRRNRFALRLVDAMTAVSTANRRVFEEAHDLSPDSVRVIHSAIDTGAITRLKVDVARKKEELGIPPAGRVIGAVGHMNGPDKGFDHLLKAFARILEKVPEAYLVICGDGPLKPQMVELSRQLGIDGHTRFLGFTPDLFGLYHAMDVFALASIREAFGLVSVEAMCASKPVVATNVGGIPDIVIDRVTGILVPPANADALAEGVVTVLKDEPLAAAMGRAGYERAVGYFGLDRMVREYENLYCRLLERRGWPALRLGCLAEGDRTVHSLNSPCLP